MDEELMSISQLKEKREKEVLIEAGKYKPGEAERTKIMNEAKLHAEIRNIDENLELTRINNQAKNEIEEEKLNIEREKVKTDRKRTRNDVLKILAAVVTYAGGTVVCYHMDKTENIYKRGERAVSDLWNFLSRR